MSLLGRIFAAFTGAVAEAAIPRTQCCGVAMQDVWQHADGCLNARAIKAKIEAWRRANPDADPTMMPHSVHVPPRGSHGGMCPECGYPTGCYGIYTVGEACDGCGYTETRFSS